MPSYSPFQALANSGVVQPETYPDTMGGFDPNNSFTTPMNDPTSPLAPNMSLSEQLRIELQHPTSNGHWIQDQQEKLTPNPSAPQEGSLMSMALKMPLPSTPTSTPTLQNDVTQTAPPPQTTEQPIISNVTSALGGGGGGASAEAPVSGMDVTKSITGGIQSSMKSEGTGAKVGGTLGTGAGAAIGGIFGGPAGAQMGAGIGQTVGDIGGSIFDYYANQSEVQQREQEKKLAQQKADKYEAMQMAEHNKALEEASQNREFALGDRQHALDLQRKKEMAIAAEQTFNIQQAKQTQRGLLGYGQNELSLMGPNPIAQQRKY